MLIGIVSTMLIYLDDSKLFFYILGLEEIILFIMTVVDMAKVSKAAAAAEKAAAEAAESAPESETEMNDAETEEAVISEDNNDSDITE